MNQFEQEIKNRQRVRIESIANNFSKGENDILSKEDFEGLRKTNEVYTPDNVLNYKSDLQKSLDEGEIEQEVFEKSIQDLSHLKIVRVENGLNTPKTFFLKAIEEATEDQVESETGEIEKGEDTEESQEEGEDIEKAEVEDGEEDVEDE